MYAVAPSVNTVKNASQVGATSSTNGLAALFAAIEEGNMEAVERLSAQFGTGLEEGQVEAGGDSEAPFDSEEDGRHAARDDRAALSCKRRNIDTLCAAYLAEGNVKEAERLAAQLADGTYASISPREGDVEMMSQQPGLTKDVNVEAMATQQLGAGFGKKGEVEMSQQPHLTKAKESLLTDGLAAAAFFSAMEEGNVEAFERLTQLGSASSVVRALLAQYHQAQATDNVSSPGQVCRSAKEKITSFLEGLPAHQLFALSGSLNEVLRSGTSQRVDETTTQRARGKRVRREIDSARPYSKKLSKSDGTTSSPMTSSVLPVWLPSCYTPSSGPEVTDKKHEPASLSVDDVINDIFGQRVLPGCDQQRFTENGKRIFQELSQQTFSTRREIWEAYENLAKACVSPRTYEQTLQIREDVQRQFCQKQGESHAPSYRTDGDTILLKPPSDKPHKSVCLNLKERKEVLRILEAMSPETRTEVFKAKRFMKVSGKTARAIWNEGEHELKDVRAGRPSTLSERTLNEIFAEACARHEVGVPFSPQTLKWYIKQFAEKESINKSAPPPSAHTLDMYYKLLKKMGLNITKKSELHEVKKWMSRLSFRNAVVAYAVAKVTHEDVCQDLILSLCQTQAVYGSHQLKIMTVANSSGVGPIVLLVKVPDSDLVGSLVKVPLFGCHPCGLSKFGTSVWFHTASLAETMREFMTENVQQFLHEVRSAVAKYVEDLRAVLWVDCGPDMSNFFTCDEGSDWAVKQNLCVNMDAPKYVGTQLGLGNAFRDTKQLLRESRSSCINPSPFLVTSFERGIQHRVKLGILKGPLLQFLAQLDVVLPQTFWVASIQKGFSTLTSNPDLDKCLKRCPDYSLAVDAEKKRLRTIADYCVEKVREKGEMTDAEFNSLNAPEDPWTGFDQTSHRVQHPSKRAHVLTHHKQISARRQKLQAIDEIRQAKEQAKKERRESKERKTTEAQENRKRKKLAREQKQKELEQAKRKKKEEKQAKKSLQEAEKLKTSKQKCAKIV